MKLKKGDTVLIISGKDKGRRGKIIEALPQQKKVVVEGINIVKKHRRPKREGQKGQVVEIAKPISASNVKLVCPKCSKPARVGWLVSGGRKDRVCKKCKQGV